MKDFEMNRIKDVIYFLLRINNKPLTDEMKEKYNDTLEKMINEDFEYNEDDFRFINKESVLGNIGDKSLPIALKFYAIVQDNLKLKEKLEKEGYLFYTSGTKMNLYALDKTFSSKFDEDDYIKLLREQERIAKRFYNSLVFEDEENRDKYIDEFAEIIHNNPDICKCSKYDEDNYGTYNNLLIVRNLRCFGKDFINKLTEEQKIVINSLNFRLEDDKLKKVKQLLELYPNKVFNIELRGEVLDSFTIEEIGTMSIKDSDLYELAMKIGFLDKMKEILKINPSFDCPRKFVSVEIFKTLSAEDIAGLTHTGIEEIGNIKIPRIDNAFIMPVRKINRCLERDKKRRMKATKDKRYYFGRRKKGL